MACRKRATFPVLEDVVGVCCNRPWQRRVSRMSSSIDGRKHLAKVKKENESNDDDTTATCFVERLDNHSPLK